MGIRVGETGFTIVEVIITLTLAALFLAFFVQMFESIAAQQFSTARQATANDIAFSNLSKFPTADSISDAVAGGYTCTIGGQNDLTSAGTKTGTLVLDNSSPLREQELRGLPEPIQEVRAYSPLGCDNDLIKIESRVSYGFTRTQGEAIYATYVR